MANASGPWSTWSRWAAVLLLALAPRAALADLPVWDEGVAANRTESPAVDPSPPSPAEVRQRVRALDRALPQEPNPTPLLIPADVTPEELEGKYGFALALVIFCGAILVAVPLALFLGWVRWLWPEEAPSSARPSRHGSR